MATSILEKRGNKGLMWALLFSICFLGISMHEARASTLFVGDSPTVTFISPGVWEWTYPITASNAVLWTDGSHNTFFTIYDFGGYIPGTETITDAGGGAPSTAGNWTFSSSKLTAPPLNVTLAVPDNHAIPNLTWTYTSQTLNVGTHDPLLFVSARSMFSPGQVRSWAAQDYTASGTRTFIGGETVVPFPEPSTILLIGAGLLGLAVWRRRRNAS